VGEITEGKKKCPLDETSQPEKNGCTGRATVETIFQYGEGWRCGLGNKEDKGLGKN